MINKKQCEHQWKIKVPEKNLLVCQKCGEKEFAIVCN